MAGSSMRDIKRRIRSVTSIEHITNAMKLISAAKLRRAKNACEKLQDNLHYIASNIDELCGKEEELPRHLIASGREIKRTCYIVVTANRGLAGSYNTNVIKAVEQKISEDVSAGKEKPLLICIGSKGLGYFSKRGHEILSEYLEPPESISFADTREIVKPVLELYDNEEIDEIIIVYTIFVSTMEQHTQIDRLLPFEPKTDRETRAEKHKKLLEFEPTAQEVFKYLVPKYAEIMMYRALIEAAACEHAARRMAMQNATDNAREMIDNLNLFYNRARQAAITSEITEIVSGADAVKK